MYLLIHHFFALWFAMSCFYAFVSLAGIPVTLSNRRTLPNECMDDDEVTPLRKITQVKNEKLLKCLIRWKEEFPNLDKL